MGPGPCAAGASSVIWDRPAVDHGRFALHEVGRRPADQLESEHVDQQRKRVIQVVNNHLQPQ